MLKIQVVAVLDEKKSETYIKESLSEISNALEQSKTSGVEIVANLDKDKTLSKISDSLKNDVLVRINEQPIKIIADLDIERTTTNIDTSLKKIAESITLKIDNSNIKVPQQNNATINTPVSANSANNANTKNTFDYKDALVNAKNYYASLGEASAKWNKTAQGQLQGFTVSVKKANGEIEKFKYSLNEKTDKPFFELTGSAGDDSGLLKLQKDIDSTKAKAKEMLSALDNKSRGVVNGTELYKSVSKSIDKITDSNGITRFNNLFKELQTLVNEVYSKARTGDSLNPIQDLQNDLSKADLSIKDLKTSLSQLQIRSAENNNSKFTANLSAIQSRIESISKTLDNLKNVNLSELTDKDELLNGVDEAREFLRDIKDTKAQIVSLNRENNAFTSSLNSVSKSQTLVFDKQKLSNRIETWLRNNTKAAKIYGNELRDLQHKIDSVTNKRELSVITGEFRKITSEASAKGLLGHTFEEELKNNISKFSQWLSIGNVVAGAIRSVKDMHTNVINLNTVMVELKKVTSETEDAYDKFLENSTVKAKELGVTITDLVDATASFSRLGYSLEDASELGKVATMYANVGDEISSVEEASKSIISTIKAFDIDAGDSMSIVDKINNVANQEAISAGGLGEALQRSASALATANNSIDEALALITAGNLVNQDPASVGTGIKTMTLRIRGAKADLEEMGEDTEGMIESTAKLQEELKAITGVDILQSDGETFKSTYRILEEISHVWNSLSDINRATVLEDLFGKRQSNIGASILENFDVAAKTLKESINSEGSAEREYEKWLDSIEAKQAQFQASFEALSNSVISSEFIKSAIEGGTAVLDIVTSLNDEMVLMPTLLAAISSAWMTKNNVGLFTQDNDGNLNFFTQTKQNNINIEANKIKQAIEDCDVAWKKLIPDQQKATSITEQLNDALVGLNPALTKGVSETGDFAEAQKKLALNVETSKKSINTLSGVTGKFKSVLSTAGATVVNFSVNLLISFAISKVASEINKASKAMEEAAERAKQVNEQSEELADTKQQVIELRSKLNDINTTESEAVSIRQQLYDIQEKLIEQYGTEASKIDLVRDSVDSLNLSFQNLDASALSDWYLEDPKSAIKSVKSIYGEGSVNGWGVNTGKENINISREINGYDLTKIQHIFTNYIGGEYWKKQLQGTYAGSYTLEVGKSVTDNGGSKKDLVDKYDDILKQLENVLINAQNEGRTDAEIAAIENLISQIGNAKDYWVDDKYQEAYNNAQEYAKYLVSQNLEQNRAYNELQKAKFEYNKVQSSGSEEDVELAYRDYKLATENIQNIIDNLGKTGNDGAIRDFLTGIIENAMTDLSKDDFIVKFKADEEGLKTSLRRIVDTFSSGKTVNSIDVINFNPYAAQNKNTPKAGAFFDIKKKADEAGVSLKTYVSWLAEVGLIQGEIADESEKLDFTPILNMNSEAMKKWTEEIDNVQSSFDTIKDVFTDYNTAGVLSIDNLQKLLALDSKYIKLLFDENGNLTLNKQAYEDLTKAKLESIKVDILRNTIEDIRKITDEAVARDWLATQTNKATEANKNLTESILEQEVASAKLKGGDIEKAVTDIYENYKNLASLIDLTTTSFDDNTEAVNKQIKALEDEKKQQEITKKSLEVQKSALEDLSKEYEDAQGKINSLVDLTVDMLKQKYEDEKEIIEKQKDAYKDKVDTLKEALDEEKDAYDKHQSILEKTNDISTLQRQALSLQGNTSVEGKQRLAEIQKELAESTQDLYDTQYEHSVNDRQDALDKEYKRKEQLWDKEIERIDEVVSNERQLRIEAMNIIDTRSDKFYNDLWGYVYEYTTKSEFEFNNLWTEAYNALDKYNFGQLTCLRIMDFLEQGVYNTGLQIDILAGQISGVSSAIDSISVSVDNLTESLKKLPPSIDPNKSIQSDDDGEVIDKNNLIEIALGGGKVYSVEDKSHLASAISIWRQWKQDYDNGQTDRTNYTVQDVYNAIAKKYPDNSIYSHYAKGTLSAKGGLSVVDEEGSELILNQPQKGRYANLGEGSVVFTKDQTEKLWELSKLSDPPKKIMDAYNKFKDMYVKVKNGNNFFVNKSNESYLSGIRGNSSIITNSVNNSHNRSITAPITVTVHNANGLNEKKLATNIKTEIFREFRKYSSWLG